MEKIDKLHCLRIAIAVFFGCMAFFFIPPSIAYGEEVYIQEETGESEQENSIYDALRERIQDSWESGMENLEEVNPIEISGNFAERILRTIAAACYSNLKSIKAGALLIGLVSFVLGAVIALLATKDKKMRQTAISAGMRYTRPENRLDARTQASCCSSSSSSKVTICSSTKSIMSREPGRRSFRGSLGGRAIFTQIGRAHV